MNSVFKRVMWLIRNHKLVAIHLSSLALGQSFRASYWALGRDSSLTQFLLAKYCATRRKLPGMTYDPTIGRSSRLGAYKAFLSTQEELDKKDLDGYY